MREQSFADYEHLIVDPGSTDGSIELIKQFESAKLRLIEEPDNGPPDGLNNGFSQASGEILLYLNADDELAPDALGRISRLHAGHPNADVITGSGWIIDESGLPVKYAPSDRFSIARTAAGVGTVVQQATSFKSRCLPSKRPFNASNRYTWDLELLCELHARGAQFQRSPEILGYFRVYEGTITGSPSLRKAIRGERRAVIGRFRPKSERFLHSFEWPARTVKFLTRSTAPTPRFPGLVAGRDDDVR